MKLYLKICLISSLTYPFTVIGSSLLSENISEYVNESEMGMIIDSEKRKYIALACDSVCREAPYLCKVAFCSVIINRIEDPAYPNTAAEIIYSDPIFNHSFKIDGKAHPSDTALSAYDDAISGYSPCPEALYFYTTESADLTLKKRPVMFQVGKYIFS